ncbi:MAG: TetR family transcriptional regulator C-terminal domain-containing protein [Pseudomonadota bacterium]
MSTPDKKPTTDKSSRIQVRNRKRILEAALDIFSRYGYRGSTVIQIAERAQMSKANLLYYYNSKSDIYIEVLENTLSAWLEPLTDLQVDGDPAEQIWAYTQTKLTLSKESPEASRLFANEILQGAPMIKEFLQVDLKQLVDSKCEVIQHWVDTGKIAAIKPLNLLFLIWAATQHYADFSAQTEILSDTPDTLHTDAEITLKTIIMNGLKAPHS